MRRLQVSLLPECLPAAGLKDSAAVVIDVHAFGYTYPNANRKAIDDISFSV